MKKFNVVWKSKTGQDVISYGEVFAKNSYDAIEQIIKDSPERLAIKDPTQRHAGLVAEYMPEQKQVENNYLQQMQQMEAEALVMKQNFDKLQNEYDEVSRKLKNMEQSSMFGATIFYKNQPDVFIPIFTENNKENLSNEKPYKFSLNFNEEILALWITGIQKEIVELED